MPIELTMVFSTIYEKKSAVELTGPIQENRPPVPDPGTRQGNDGWVLYTGDAFNYFSSGQVPPGWSPGKGRGRRVCCLPGSVLNPWKPFWRSPDGTRTRIPNLRKEDAGIAPPSQVQRINRNTGPVVQWWHKEEQMAQKKSKARIYAEQKMAALQQGVELEKAHEQAMVAAGLTEESLAVSLQKAEAGKVGAAESNRVQYQEERRLRAGKEFQPKFDKVKSEVLAELKNYEGKPGIDLEALRSFCCHLIEDGPGGWQREYPTEEDIAFEYDNHRNDDGTLNVDKSVVQEEQKHMGCFPSVAASQIVDEIQHVELSKLPLFKNLVIKSLEQFVELVGKDEKTRNEMIHSFPRLPEQIKQALPKIQADVFYFGPWIAPVHVEPQRTYKPIGVADNASTGSTQAQLRAAAEKQEREEEQRAIQREQDRILREAREKENQRLQELAPNAWAYLKQGR